MADRVVSAEARCTRCSWAGDYSGRWSKKSALRASKRHADELEHAVKITVEVFANFGELEEGRPS